MSNAVKPDALVQKLVAALPPETAELVLEYLDRPWATVETFPHERLVFDFPGGQLKTDASGRVLQFPKWCPAIHVQRSNEFLEDALRMMDTHERLAATEVLGDMPGMRG